MVGTWYTASRTQGSRSPSGKGLGDGLGSQGESLWCWSFPNPRDLSQAVFLYLLLAHLAQPQISLDGKSGAFRVGKSEPSHPLNSYTGFTAIFSKTVQQSRLDKYQRKTGESLNHDVVLNQKGRGEKPYTLNSTEPRAHNPCGTGLLPACLFI